MICASWWSYFWILIKDLIKLSWEKSCKPRVYKSGLAGDRAISLWSPRTPFVLAAVLFGLIFCWADPSATYYWPREVQFSRGSFALGQLLKEVSFPTKKTPEKFRKKEKEIYKFLTSEIAIFDKLIEKYSVDA